MLIVCMGAAVYLGVKGVRELRDRRAGVDYYRQLTEQVGEPTGETTPVPDDEAQLQQEVLLADQDPLAADVPLLQIDFEELQKTCPDVVGWIRICDTFIDYPVVRGTDNDYYLSHLPNRAYNSGGSIMMDVACDPGFGSEVTVLHGHHMKSGAMFGDLDEYKDPEYFAAHPIIELYTPEGYAEVQIFAACTVNARTFGYETSFASRAAFDAYVQKAKAASPFDAGVDVQYGDRILLLSTCNYSYEDARFIVLGKIVPE